MLALVGIDTRKVYATGHDKAECLRKVNADFPGGPYSDKMKKKLGIGPNSSNVIPEPLKFYKVKA